MKHAFLAALALCACAAFAETIEEKAAVYLRAYPYWYTGSRAPGPSKEQLAYAKAAREFIRAHALESLSAARKMPPTGTLFACLAYHGCGEFEPLFMEKLKSGEFIQFSQHRTSDETLHAVLGYLGARRSAAAVEPLCILLNNFPGDWNGPLADALGAIGDPRAVPTLITQLESKTVYPVTQSVIPALRAIGDRRAVEPLCKLLQNNDTALAAAYALVALGDKRAVPAFEEAVRRFKFEPEYFWLLLQLDADNAVRHIAEKGDFELAQFLEFDDAARWLRPLAFDRKNERWRDAAAKLAQLGDESVAALLKEDMLLHPETYEKSLAGCLKLHDPEAEALLLWLAETQFSNSYGGAFGNIQSGDLAAHLTKAALPLIRRDVDKANAGRNYSACFDALCKLGDASDKDRIVAYCTRGMQQTTPLDYLSRHSVPDSLALARKFVEQTNEGFQQALSVIAKHGEAQDAALLFSRIGNMYDEVRNKAVVEAYVELANRHAGAQNAVFVMAVAALRGAQVEQVPRPVWAAYGLSQLGFQEGHDALGKILKNAFEGDLHHDLWQVRDALQVFAIQPFGDLEGIQRGMADCSDELLKMECAQTLCKVYVGKYPPALNLCVQALKKETRTDILALALRGIGESGTEGTRHARAVEAMALHTDTQVVVAALATLARIGDQKSLAFLKSYPLGRRRDIMPALKTARLELQTRLKLTAPDSPPVKPVTFFDEHMLPREELRVRWLEMAQKSVNETHRQNSALVSLCHLKDIRALPLLAELMRTPVSEVRIEPMANDDFKAIDFAVEQLPAFGPDGETCLSRFATSGSWYAMREAQKALAKLKNAK